MGSPYILFLYTRLPDYFYQAIKSFLNRHPQFRVVVFTHQADKNAPYFLDEAERLEIRFNEDFENDADFYNSISGLNIVSIYVAGWTNKRYLSLVEKYRLKIPVILGLDNPWKGSLRQRVGTLLYKAKLQKKFSHIWCAGMPQIEFARRLGFSYGQILTSLYSANTEKFHAQYHEKLAKQQQRYPKRLLFLGRYVDYKQPILLARQFEQLVKENNHDSWELDFIGAGPLIDQLKAFESDFIHVKGFIPPETLPKQLANYGAFCLPSQNEHWGVVVHEAAASGLPLLLSDSVYSGTTFLIENYNGWRFKSKSEIELRKALINLFNTPDAKLLEMGANSYRLSKKVTHLDWEANLLSVFNP